MIEYTSITIFLIGLALLLIPSRFAALIKSAALTGAAVTLFYGINGFLSPVHGSLTGFFAYNSFAGFIALACAFFCFITVSFSLQYADFIKQANQYYGLIFWCVSFSIAAVYSTNLVALVVFWGLSGMTLYLLANLMPEASNASKKSFIFVGGSDAFMVLGIAILWKLTGTFNIYDIRLNLADGSILAKVSFLCLTIAAFTKAGAMPFHSWIPDFAEKVPLSLTALLPAALDKLLGVFLLVIVCNQLFLLDTAMSLLLLLTGSLTIIFAAYMALIQNDIKKLLAYSAIAQVGYIILGIASGTALGMAGALFYMINHAIYKSCLFLTGAAVEHRAGTTQFDKLGGLSKYMPVTFAICLIAVFTASGIPPFSGFAAKWMVYQSLIMQYSNPGLSQITRLFYLSFLVSAMFGSALTLAALVKLVHSVFLGQPSETSGETSKKISEVGYTMLAPMGLLAALCAVFGFAPNFAPLNSFIYPSLKFLNIAPPEAIGLWEPMAATALIALALAAGAGIFYFGKIKFQSSNPFIGGEDLPLEAKAPGADFYRTVSDMSFFSKAYALAGKKFFDIYDMITAAVTALGRFLSFVHTGSLHTYLLLFLLGFTAVILFMR